MTNSDRFEGTTTLEERVPLATDEEFRVLVSFFDTDSLRTQFATVLIRRRLR